MLSARPLVLAAALLAALALLLLRLLELVAVRRVVLGLRRVRRCRRAAARPAARGRAQRRRSVRVVERRLVSLPRLRLSSVLAAVPVEVPGRVRLRVLAPEAVSQAERLPLRWRSRHPLSVALLARECLRLRRLRSELAAAPQVARGQLRLRRSAKAAVLLGA